MPYPMEPKPQLTRACVWTGINDLPADVGMLIIEHLDLPSLRSLVRASPGTHAIYMSHRESLLRSSLLRTLGAVAPEAVAAFELQQFFLHSASNDPDFYYSPNFRPLMRREVWEILTRNFPKPGGPSDDGTVGNLKHFSLDLLIRVSRFHQDVVQPIVTDLYRTGWGEILNYGSQSLKPQAVSRPIPGPVIYTTPSHHSGLNFTDNPLSPPEINRITSSLYRYQFITMFTRDRYAFSADVCQWPFSNMTSPQRKGVDSIQHFVSSVILNVLTALEEIPDGISIITDIVNTMVRKSERTSILLDPDWTVGASTHSLPIDLETERQLNRVLSLPTQGELAECILENLIKLDLETLQKLIALAKDHAIPLSSIMQNTGIGRRTVVNMPQKLYPHWHDRFRNSNDDFIDPGQGWFLLQMALVADSSSYTILYNEIAPLGYIFWDRDRLSRSHINKMLPFYVVSRSCNRLYRSSGDLIREIVLYKIRHRIKSAYPEVFRS
ncbi:hypothetical protein QBC43DRAFT_303736 [Cladorrhinum sp. PSN259]|nr:hypothetical protein QBC43DRAFT_303736 [Cladorrhinum sp. PSN259]